MSIPDRLWRVVKGQWAVASERFAEAEVKLESQAEAYEELAAHLRDRHTAPVTPTGAPPTAAPTTHGAIDPLVASYELLQTPLSSDLVTVEKAYQARLAELDALAIPGSSATNPALEARRHAVEAAYDRIRDTLNPTETRFERLEF